MIKTVAAVISTVALGGALTQVDIDAMYKSSVESTSALVMRSVFTVASAEAALAGVPFSIALEDAVGSTDDPHAALSVEDTILFWKLGDDCFMSKFPDELTWVSPVRCPPDALR